MRKRKKIVTDDGSVSFVDEELNESFHSTHGAVNESEHIFIRSALDFHSKSNELSVFEYGWGTGLNSYLAWQWAMKNQVKLKYSTIELYPLEESEFQQLNFHEIIPALSYLQIQQLHNLPWEENHHLDDFFTFQKLRGDIQNLKVSPNRYDVIFFDAFSPGKQAALWSEEVFGHCYLGCKKGAVLTSYSVSGKIRRALKAAGFQVEKIPGPKGKREITRAYKQ
jgi:tRNA U34 5-methylaminomethyl-2-thiouridine-forming methyltransferase MnmC